MPAPLATVGVTVNRGDIKRVISFPSSLKDGKELEQRRQAGILAPIDQIKLNNFIAGRGLSQALKTDGSLAAQYTPKDIALVELFDALK